MRYIELFAGIGGMGYGLMQAGMECVGFCEIDKFAHQAFKILHDPEERMWSAYDVRSVTDEYLRLLERERGHIELIAGGFPCQAFSIAGKRQGFADATRGTLFFEIIRFAFVLRPNYLLLENVTGLLSHDGGATFSTIICALDELGYDAEWCVLNSAAYVPQNRERVFIVASARGQRRPEIFPFGAENSDAVEVVGRIDDKPVQFSFDGEGIAYCLDTGYPKGISHTHWEKGRRTHIVHSIDLKAQGSQTRRGAIKTERVGALDTGCMIAVTQDYRIRKLTPLECFRLQSFPDEWYYKLKEAGISDSQLYKMAGNAVTSRVAYEIGKRIMEATP